MVRARSLTLAVALVTIGVARTRAGHAQAVTDPNQLVGNVDFVNERVEILDRLRSTMRPAVVDLAAFGVGVPLDHSTVGHPTIPPSSAYELTVESGNPGTAYDVSVVAWLGNGASYVFARQRSDLVSSEPAPDVELSFSECAALVRVVFVDGRGQPRAIAGSVVLAPSIPYGRAPTTRRQASLTIAEGATSGELLVTGDGNPIDLELTVSVGADVYHDKVSYQSKVPLRPTCDEIDTIEVTLEDGLVGGMGVEVDVSPPGGGTGNPPPVPPSPIGLGRIVGEIDVLGEDEVNGGGWPVLSDRTGLAAWGPWQNSRRDHVDRDPSSGDFELEHLVPSTATVPPMPWGITGTMGFRFGRAHEILEPFVSTIVGDGAEVDLGDVFVFDPGTISGTVSLSAPPAGPGERPILATLDHATDGRPDRLPFLGFDAWKHCGVLASALETPTSRITAWTDFHGDAVEGRSSFTGPYELRLGGFHRRDADWRVRQLRLMFYDTTTPSVPESHVSVQWLMTDEDAPWIPVSQGSHDPQDLRACLSTVRLGVTSTSGAFSNPSVVGTGRFDGVDGFGVATRRSVTIERAYGTPSEPASAGLVVLPLPEGDYVLRTTVTSANPGGGTSTTELPPIDVSCGCRQVLDVLREVQVAVHTTLSECTEDRDVLVFGAVAGTGEIARLTWRIEDGPETVLCTACGPNPQFSFVATLVEADNEIHVTAEDALGRRAELSSFTRHPVEPSALDLRPAATPLRVVKDGPSAVALTWESMPNQLAHVHEGTLASLWRALAYDHRSLLCSLADSFATRPTSARDSYYLVGSDCGSGTGGLGRDSNGRARSASSPGCR